MKFSLHPCKNQYGICFLCDYFAPKSRNMKSILLLFKNMKRFFFFISFFNIIHSGLKKWKNSAKTSKSNKKIYLVKKNCSIIVSKAQGPIIYILNDKFHVKTYSTESLLVNAPNQVVGCIIQKRKSNKYNIISPDFGPLLVVEFLFYFSELKKKKTEIKTD